MVGDHGDHRAVLGMVELRSSVQLLEKRYDFLRGDVEEAEVEVSGCSLLDTRRDGALYGEVGGSYEGEGSSFYLKIELLILSSPIGTRVLKN